MGFHEANVAEAQIVALCWLGFHRDRLPSESCQGGRCGGILVVPTRVVLELPSHSVNLDGNKNLPRALLLQ